MCDDHGLSLLDSAVADHDIEHSIEILLANLPPKMSDLFNRQTIYERCLPLLVEPVGVVEGTPEKESCLFRCMFCSQVFQGE